MLSGRVRYELERMGDEERAALLVRVPLDWMVILYVAYQVGRLVVTRTEGLVDVE